MKNTTIYGIKCSKKDEKILVGRLNEFLGQYHRVFSKTKSKSIIEGYLPFVYKHIFINLNKEIGSFMSLSPNEDSEGKYRYQNNKEVGWILKIIIHKHFPGYEKTKTESYITNILDVMDFEFIILSEYDGVED